MSKIKKITKMQLFLPIFSMLLVMFVNVIYDIASGNAPFSFFAISTQLTSSGNTILYGRLIDILNRGSEVAILAIGMTLVVSASAGTDISVYDLNGVKVYHTRAAGETLTLDLGAVHPGIMVVRIGGRSVKIIKK